MPINPCFKTRCTVVQFVSALAIVCWTSFATAEDAPAPKLTISQSPDGPQVLVDGKLFTQYLTSSGARPVLWPVYGPTSAPMTRSYSVGPAEPGEETDHPHHRSIWFGYEGINGADFWHGGEFTGSRTYPAGSVKHREFQRADSDGRTATIITRNDYLDAIGQRVAVDERQLSFGADANSRWIDFIIVLKSPGQPLVIGDTKEGAFALRVSEKLRSDRNPASAIVTSRGDRNDAAWGKPPSGLITRARLMAKRWGSRSSRIPAAIKRRRAGMCGRMACSPPIRLARRTIRAAPLKAASRFRKVSRWCCDIKLCSIAAIARVRT